jgi:hypothetical protein
MLIYNAIYLRCGLVKLDINQPGKSGKLFSETIFFCFVLGASEVLISPRLYEALSLLFQIAIVSYLKAR